VESNSIFCKRELPRSLSIQRFEKMCPDVTRRTLQRELKDLIDKGLVRENSKYYFLEPQNPLDFYHGKFFFNIKVNKQIVFRAYVATPLARELLLVRQQHNSQNFDTMARRLQERIFKNFRGGGW